MEPKQYWVRNEQGRVWGPLPSAQIQTLIERKLIAGITEVSLDGFLYMPAQDEPVIAPLLAKMSRSTSGTYSAFNPAPKPSPVSVHPAGPPPTLVPQAAPKSAPPLAPAAPLPPGATVRAIQAVPPEGRVEEQSGLKLYYLIAAAEAQGKLTLGEGVEEIVVWFKAGTPHAVECPALGLGEYLVAQRVLTVDQLATSAGRILAAGGDVASGLFAAGLLNPQSAFPLIQQHAHTLLQRGLLLERGPFKFDPSAPVPASGFQLGQRWQLLTMVARRVDPLRLRHWVEARAAQVPRVAGSVIELQLTAQETRLLSSVDGTKPLPVLSAAAGPLAETLLKLLFLLTEIDRVLWSGGAEAIVAPAPAPAVAPDAAVAAPPPAAPAEPSPGGLAEAIAKAMAQKGMSSAPPLVTAPPPPAAPPKAVVPAAPKPIAAPAQRPAAPAPKPAAVPAAAPAAIAAPQTVDSLTKFRDDLMQKDLYARLNLPRSRNPIPTLKAAYFQLAKIYHPDTVPPDAPEQLRTLKADISSLLNEASRILSDDAKRTEYFDELEAKESVGDLDVVAILAAEEDFQRAIVLARGRKFADALAIIESCIQINPKEGEFYAWRGYCKFFGATDKRAAREAAMADARKALEINPKCVVAWVFQGDMWKLLEDTAMAKEAYRSALALDPKNLEAKRELRLFEQRKK